MDEALRMVAAAQEVAPRRADRLRAWWGQVDPHWHQPHAMSVSDMYVHSVTEPRSYELAGMDCVEFVTPCPGEACSGAILRYYGPAGGYVQAVPCPLHRGLFKGEEELDDSGWAGALQQQRAIALSEAEIPLFYTHFTFDNWPGEDRAALDACRVAARDVKSPRGLLLLGGFGTGKSSLAKAFLEQRVARFGQSGLFVSTADMLQRLKPGFDTDERLLSRLKSVAVLVLDDLGAERSDTNFGLDMLWQVLSYRHDHALVTVATSNHPSTLIWEKMNKSVGKDWGATLEDNLGERIVQRFLDEAAYEVIIVRGRDLRLHPQLPQPDLYKESKTR